jgi:hypothetical protein
MTMRGNSKPAAPAKPIGARPDKSLGQITRRTLIGQQQRQPRQPQIRIGVARDQTRHQGIGKAAMRRIE